MVYNKHKFPSIEYADRCRLIKSAMAHHLSDEQLLATTVTLLSDQLQNVPYLFTIASTPSESLEGFRNDFWKTASFNYLGVLNDCGIPFDEDEIVSYAVEKSEISSFEKRAGVALEAYAQEHNATRETADWMRRWLTDVDPTIANIPVTSPIALSKSASLEPQITKMGEYASSLSFLPKFLFLSGIPVKLAGDRNMEGESSFAAGLLTVLCGDPVDAPLFLEKHASMPQLNGLYALTLNELHKKKVESQPPPT